MAARSAGTHARRSSGARMSSFLRELEREGGKQKEKGKKSIAIYPGHNSIARIEYTRMHAEKIKKKKKKKKRL